ncbi:hypothetical protein [Bacillus sp. AK031]
MRKPIQEDFKYRVRVTEISDQPFLGPKGAKYSVRYEIRGDKTEGSYIMYFSERLVPLRRDYSNNYGMGHESIENFIRPFGKDRPTAKREVATIFDIVRKEYPVF